MRQLFLYFVIFIIIFIIFPLYKMFFENPIPHFFHTPAANIGIVFGASIMPNGHLSPTLKNRMDDAIFLYQNHQIEKILLSGFGKGKIHRLNEPAAMNRYALSQGVKKKDILIDNFGNNTYLTIKHVKNIEQKYPFIRVIYVSSQFHLPRIIMLSHMIGITSFQVFFQERPIFFQTIFQKYVMREIFAYWGYLFFYPFYQINQLFEKIKFSQ